MEGMTTHPFDPAAHPDACFRIDSFTVPDAARAELEATMHRNMDFIRTLPGFLGHVAFEKRAGPARRSNATWPRKPGRVRRNSMFRCMVASSSVRAASGTVKVSMR